MHGRMFKQTNFMMSRKIISDIKAKCTDECQITEQTNGCILIKNNVAQNLPLSTLLIFSYDTSGFFSTSMIAKLEGES